MINFAADLLGRVTIVHFVVKASSASFSTLSSTTTVTTTGFQQTENWASCREAYSQASPET